MQKKRALVEESLDRKFRRTFFGLFRINNSVEWEMAQMKDHRERLGEEFE
jgi:hypothetical protein